jgi:hypothetical protein
MRLQDNNRTTSVGCERQACRQECLWLTLVATTHMNGVFQMSKPLTVLKVFEVLKMLTAFKVLKVYSIDDRRPDSGINAQHRSLPTRSRTFASTRLPISVASDYSDRSRCLTVTI